MRRPKKKAAKKAAKKGGKKTVKKTNKKTVRRTPKKAAKKKAVRKTARKPAAKPKARKAKKPARKPPVQKKKIQKKKVQKKAARKTAARPATTRPAAAPRPAAAAPRPRAAPAAAPAAAAPSAASVAAHVDRLDLDSWAKEAATQIATEFPEIRFTSGRRDPAGQARAMAHNIVTAPAGRNWIRVTYRDTPESREMQQWVDDHRDATSEADIAAGLLGVMTSWEPARLGNMSRHLIGLAFDIQPFSGGNAERIKERMGSLPHLHGTPLFREGGVERWHVAFKSQDEEPE